MINAPAVKSRRGFAGLFDKQIVTIFLHDKLMDFNLPTDSRIDLFDNVANPLFCLCGHFTAKVNG